MDNKLIADVIHGSIDFSDFESQLLRTSIINRLHQILQDSTAFTVFPSNKTTRFEHSVGAMHIASQIYTNSLINANRETCISFLANIDSSIQSWIRDRDQYSLKKELLSVISQAKTSYPNMEGSLKELFCVSEEACLIENIYCKASHPQNLHAILGRQFSTRHTYCLTDLAPCIKECDKNLKYVYFMALQAVRIYGLLHDIGHLPFSHMFESALKKTLSQVTKDQISDSPILTEISSLWLHNNRRDGHLHEKIGHAIIRFVFYDLIISKLTDVDLDESNVLYAFNVLIIFSILDSIVHKKNNQAFFALRCIIDNPIDADRIDFTERQLLACGLGQKTFNKDRLLGQFTLCEVPVEFLDQPSSTGNSELEPVYRFVPSIQSLFDVENLLTSRFNLYRTMVNHHAVRRSDYILQNMIEIFLQESLSAKQKYQSKMNNVHPSINDVLRTLNIIINSGLPQNSVYGFANMKHTDWQEFKTSIYQYTQLTDYWLMSSFNERYIQYIINPSTQKNDCQWQLLSDFFHNTRHYISLWKRYDDYEIFLKEIGTTLRERAIRLLHIQIQEVAKMCSYCEKRTNTVSEEHIKENFHLYPDHFGVTRKIDIETSPTEIGKFVLFVLSDFGFTEKSWTADIERKVRESSEYEVLVVPNKLDTGIKPPGIFIYNSNAEMKVSKFKEVSGLEDALKDDIDKSVRFYVYYKKVLDHSTVLKFIALKLLELAEEKLLKRVGK